MVIDVCAEVAYCIPHPGAGTGGMWMRDQAVSKAVDSAVETPWNP